MQEVARDKEVRERYEGSGLYICSKELMNVFSSCLREWKIVGLLKGYTMGCTGSRK